MTIPANSVVIEAVCGTLEHPIDTTTVANADAFIVHLFEPMDDGIHHAMPTPVEELWRGVSYAEAQAVAQREADARGLPVALWELD